MSEAIRREYETELRAEPTEAERARARTRDQLQAWGLDDLIEVVELVVSELVTNAVLHGKAPVTLRLALNDVLRLEVHDASLCPPTPRRAGPEGPRGRGLELVGLLADQWGWQPAGHGKLVWAELVLPHADTPPRTGQPDAHPGVPRPRGDGGAASAYPGDGAALVRPGDASGLSGACLDRLARHILANPN